MLLSADLAGALLSAPYACEARRPTAKQPFSKTEPNVPLISVTSLGLRQFACQSRERSFWMSTCTRVGMNLKNAAFLALIGTLLLTVLVAMGFINDALGVARGIIAPVKLVVSLIETFAG